MSIKVAGAAFLALTAAVPARAEWHEARSNHFIIYANEPADELLAYTERLERFDRAVRMVRKMGDPALTDSGRIRMFVLPTDAAVGRLCDCGNVVGFYITRHSGSVAFVPRKAGLTSDKFDLDADAVFFHEYAHHLQMQTADVALPPWASEGFAEFFARTQLREDGSAVIGVPPAYRSYSLLENNSVGIRDLVGANPLFAGGEGIYSRGWALTHYLTFEPKRRGQFDRYIASIQKGVPPLTAAQQAFGDLGSLTSQLGAYVRRKKLPHLVLSGVNVPGGSIGLRQLSPAEAAILPTYIRTQRRKKSSVRNVAADARRAASAFPGNAFAQTVLAEAEFEAGNYAAADGAATRALTARPKDVAALIAKGKAQMEMARTSPATDWHTIRKWFLDANKLDPEAAEPLMRFYQTYLYAGQQPTPNAVDGLLYAAALVPQDSKLRLMAVRQLLRDSNLAKAKSTFAPFAFSPHSKNAWNAASAKAVASMNDGNAAEALRQIERLQRLLEDDD